MTFVIGVSIKLEVSSRPSPDSQSSRPVADSLVPNSMSSCPEPDVEHITVTTYRLAVRVQYFMISI